MTPTAASVSFNMFYRPRPLADVKHCSIMLSHQGETYWEILIQGNITDGLGAA